MSQTYRHVPNDLAHELNVSKDHLNATMDQLNEINQEKENLDFNLLTSQNKAEKQKAELKRTAGREVYWREKYREMDDRHTHITNVITMDKKC